MIHRITQLLTVSALLCAPTLFAAGAIDIKTVSQFNELHKSNKPMVTMYTATWCGPCKSTKPHFRTLAETMPEVNFCIIDVDNKTLSSLTSGIRGIPTFKFSHKGQPVNFTIDNKVSSNFSGGRSKTELSKILTNFKTKCPKN